MINPKDFIASNTKQSNDHDLIEMSGSFSCPEQGCFEVTKQGRFNERDRIITWVCINGHLGRATI